VKQKQDPAASSLFNTEPIDLPTFSGRKWSAHFDEPELSSDAGLAAIAASGVGEKLIADIASAVDDPRRAPDHDNAELIGQRVFQILSGSYDADDCDHLREDIVLRSAAGRQLEEGPLASQPTMSRLENRVRRADLLRIAQVIFKHYLDDFGDDPPPMICIDMDPSAHLTYGQQQLSLFNTHVGDHCLMPFYIFDGCSGKIMTAVLRPGKTPVAGEIITILKRLVAGIRERWPKMRITFRADSHHTKPEVLDWLHANEVDFATGLAKNDALDRLFFDPINQARRDYQRKLEQGHRGKGREELIVTHYADDLYAAKSWSQKERVVARIIVGPKGVDVRYIVSSFYKAEAKYLYTTVYCQRGNAELFIKECKLGLGSDRSSCNRAESNQFRLLLHVAAYVMLHRFRETVLADTKWERATFAEIRLRVLKVAGRLEVLKTRVKLHMASAIEEMLGGVWRNAAAVGAGSG
jgi:hypothetical protein